MRSKLNIRWLAVSGIWLAALALTYWNAVGIDSVAAAREKNAHMLTAISFQRQNAPQLTQVLASNGALTLKSESVDLGIVEVRSRLNNLGARASLRNLKMATQVIAEAENQVLCDVSGEGQLHHVVNFLSGLEAYPYLTVRNMRIRPAADSDGVEMETELVLQYALIPLPHSPDASPQVISHSPQPEAKSL